MLGETLDSFDHFLYFTLWGSRVFDGNENVGRAIENLFCLRFSFDARVSNSGHVSTEAQIRRKIYLLGSVSVERPSTVRYVYISFHLFPLTQVYRISLDISR